MINMAETFQKYGNDYLEFSFVENKLSPRPDMCALLLLEKLIPGNEGMLIKHAEYGEIVLGVNIGLLMEVATEEDILTLIRCGVRYDSEFEILKMLIDV